MSYIIEPSSVDIEFDVQVYGHGGGVMAFYRAEGITAEEIARHEAEYWTNVFQASRVGVWACDRRSGFAQVKVQR